MDAANAFVLVPITKHVYIFIQITDRLLIVKEGLITCSLLSVCY